MNTFEWFELDIDMQARDRAVIDTNKGRKSVRLVRNGASVSVINHIVYGSTFLQLAVGTNEIVCGAAEGVESLSLTIRFSERFGGV
jgi:hypothetical protein